MGDVGFTDGAVLLLLCNRGGALDMEPLVYAGPAVQVATEGDDGVVGRV